MIYCGYQGCGKTTYCNNFPDKNIDLDSHRFMKGEGWEASYVQTAVALSRMTDKNVFISAHKEVVAYVMKHEIPFELLIPAQEASVWRSRLEFRFNSNPTQGNLNAIRDFEQNFFQDMAFYATLDCVKHTITAKIITSLSDEIPY